MSFDRITLVEQKVEIMQKEVSQVLQEMQLTMQSLAITYGTALKVLNSKLEELEKRIPTDSVRSTQGVEL